jgi:hypothetical protein
MLNVRFFIGDELVMAVILRYGPPPSVGDLIRIEGKIYLAESRIWQFAKPDPESVTINIYGQWGYEPRKTKIVTLTTECGIACK